MNSPAGNNGFFANIRANLPFGASNVSNTVIPGPGATGNPAYQPAQSQLQPKNDNQTPGEPGNKQLDLDATGNPRPEGSSLDGFTDIFKMPVDDKGISTLASDPFAEPLMSLDPAKLREAASKMNFAAGINPELLQKAMSGADPQAFMAVLNTVAQNGFTGATTALSGIVEQTIAKNNERFERALPERIRTTQIKQAPVKHKALAHPAAAPMVAALKSQIATTNPHLSPERVAEMAEGYIIAMSTDMNRANEQQNQQTQKAGETDWNALLS